MRYDFHTHSFLSDGASHPLEVAYRAKQAGHRAIAITDHAGLTDARHLVPRLAKECEAATESFGLLVVPGVELTYVPPRRIGAAANAARRAGAVIVIVHGETLNGPTPKGTNAAAVRAAGVDVLAHPGLISKRDAEAAAGNGVFLEVSSKVNHSLANGHVVRAAQGAGARLLVNSDTHTPEMLLSEARARQIAAGAGLSGRALEDALVSSPRALLKRHGLG
ncbi:MAG TPA: histidinol phosphate phosphatase domain-containing protein [Candidatus Thermoplasmatota archaeon]